MFKSDNNHSLFWIISSNLLDMQKKEQHSFHIPVMGIAYTIDSPLKVGKFGISSVLSLVDDHLIEKMRKIYSEKESIQYNPILTTDYDYRAKRIKEYLNLIQELLQKQINKLKAESFIKGNDIVKYFELLPESSVVKKLYNRMLKAGAAEQINLQEELKNQIKAGSIDVNIMTKCDRSQYSKSGEELAPEYSDAMAALRGFALSEVTSSVVFSAGLNPRLYSYCEQFNGFYPDENGHLKKKIILKVSDFRSAMVQGKFFAKKGLLISEFRIESGINCGGHAFISDGTLLGPILEEFKNKRKELEEELFNTCNNALESKNKLKFKQNPSIRITIQGGIGTHNEQLFLLENYFVNGTGWGSPFLLVPEATTLDLETLSLVSQAKKEDYFLSNASPLGVPFHNLKNTTAQKLRIDRIEKGRPGAPCKKKFLAFNTSYGGEPICTASREYQNSKKAEIENQKNSKNSALLSEEINQLQEKECLCEGLSASALLNNHQIPDNKITAVTICPGPNLAYFTGTFSLKEMIDHIYGRNSILNNINRPHLFVNELELYVDYIKKEIKKQTANLQAKQINFYEKFQANLLSGIEYYNNLIPKMKQETKECLDKFKSDLSELEEEIKNFVFPKIAIIPVLD